MRRVSFASIPLIVAATVFALSSSTVRAQQQHDHDAATAADTCACCGKSGTVAKNESAGLPAEARSAKVGCCADMAKTAAADEAPANHEPPTAAIQATAQGSGCCSGMSMNHGAGVSADAHDAKAGCCGMAAMNHDGGLPAEARSAKVGCCAHMADHQATASSPAFGATKGCSPDLAPEDPSVTE